MARAALASFWTAAESLIGHQRLEDAVITVHEGCEAFLAEQGADDGSSTTAAGLDSRRAAAVSFSQAFW